MFQTNREEKPSAGKRKVFMMESQLKKSHRKFLFLSHNKPNVLQLETNKCTWEMNCYFLILTHKKYRNDSKKDVVVFWGVGAF